MKKRVWAFVGMLVFCMFPIWGPSVQAGVFDRIKDIYQAPDKLDELQEQYEATKSMLENQLQEQREQLELSRQQAIELLERQDELQQANESYRADNEAYRRQNEALLEENRNLIERMEELERKRQSLYRNAFTAVAVVAGLLAAYALSVRIWRFAVWRRHRRSILTAQAQVAASSEGDHGGETLP